MQILCNYWKRNAMVSKPKISFSAIVLNVSFALWLSLFQVMRKTTFDHYLLVEFSSIIENFILLTCDVLGDFRLVERRLRHLYK